MSFNVLLSCLVLLVAVQLFVAIVALLAVYTKVVLILCEQKRLHKRSRSMNVRVRTMRESKAKREAGWQGKKGQKEGLNKIFNCYEKLNCTV